MRDGQCMDFTTPGGHRRIGIEGLQRFLRQYGTPLSIPALYIRILISYHGSYHLAMHGEVE